MSDDIVNIEIDGRAHQARKGQMIIEVTDASDVYVPRFCYHRKLSIAANCRMCMVEVEKVPNPLPACATPVAEGMKVFTRSRLAAEAQATADGMATYTTHTFGKIGSAFGTFWSRLASSQTNDDENASPGNGDDQDGDGR